MPLAHFPIHLTSLQLSSFHLTPSSPSPHSLSHPPRFTLSLMPLTSLPLSSPHFNPSLIPSHHSLSHPLTSLHPPLFDSPRLMAARRSDREPTGAQEHRQLDPQLDDLEPAGRPRSTRAAPIPLPCWPRQRTCLPVGGRGGGDSDSKAGGCFPLGNDGRWRWVGGWA